MLVPSHIFEALCKEALFELQVLRLMAILRLLGAPISDS